MLKHDYRDFLGSSKDASGDMRNTLRLVFRSGIVNRRKELTPTQLGLIGYALSADIQLLN